MSDFTAESLTLLRTLPIPLAALLLQQVLRHELMFPREKLELEATLDSLRVPRSLEMERAVAAFQALHVPEAMRSSAWQKEPAAWVEGFTAAMWTTGQIEAYRNAAKLALPPQAKASQDAVRRAVVVTYDNRLRADEAAPSLFRRLRSEGTLFTAVRSVLAGELLKDWIIERAERQQMPYSHWCLSGDENLSGTAGSKSIAALTYTSLRPARQRLLKMMNEARLAMSTGGPEGLRRSMQALTPDQMGLAPDSDPVMRAFATDVLVGGSGTQLYSTTFVQWTAREVLRRAQPRTLIARFTARSASSSMDSRLAQPTQEPPPDFAGSLVDAEMGAYLTYLNLMRLPSTERPHFLAWHEGYGQALLIGEGVSAGAQDTRPVQFINLLKQLG